MAPRRLRGMWARRRLWLRYRSDSAHAWGPAYPLFSTPRKKWKRQRALFGHIPSLSVHLFSLTKKVRGPSDHMCPFRLPWPCQHPYIGHSTYRKGRNMASFMREEAQQLSSCIRSKMRLALPHMKHTPVFSHRTAIEYWGSRAPDSSIKPLTLHVSVPRRDERPHTQGVSAHLWRGPLLTLSLIHI